MILTMRLFEAGDLAATPGALEALATHNIDMQTLVQRHLDGDWGDVDAHDREVNMRDLAEVGRLISAYQIDGVRLWIITEADRSRTTILLPEEY